MIKPNESALKMLEGPWLRQYVGNHLIFGPLSRKFSLHWILLSLSILYFLQLIFESPVFSIYKIGGVIQRIFFIIIALIFMKMPRYHQAVCGWLVIKFTMGFFCLIMLVAGGLVGFVMGKNDAIYLTLLALIWMPGVEFIPKFKEKQKHITITRILVTIPIAYLGYQTGNWVW